MKTKTWLSADSSSHSQIQVALLQKPSAVIFFVVSGVIAPGRIADRKQAIEQRLPQARTFQTPGEGKTRDIDIKSRWP